jgi:molybdopterin synthase sulfur carrier subunit
VIFHIPAALREFAGGRSSVEIDYGPAMLNDVLAQLWQLYPGLRDRMVTEQGQVRTHINIFVGDENIRYLGGLATPVPADAVISIIPAVSGGAPQADCVLACSASSRRQVR